MNETKAVVDEFLRRTAAGDTPERIAELYAETVDWRVSWPVSRHPAVPWIRPRSTRADVADHYRTFAAVCVPEAGEVRLDEIIVDGPVAVLFGASFQQVKPTGKRFAMTFALRLAVQDGLIAKHHMYEDSLAVEAAFGARPA
ncbi:nuclear transport factor 2 family protein [Amycolatopsis sp. NPDC004079]|uniref:nuclear transport factor 2 family protein n=1 Tax=Amycolatopsis sp. NPDC004079 TaxID=3154549 RepID=UPI0033A57474